MQRSPPRQPAETAGSPPPKRKPPAHAGKPVGRPKQSKAATAPCYSEQELTAVELALPAEWPVEHYAYGPCEPNYAPTIFSYDRHGRLLTVQEPGGMGGATSLQYVRNGRPKRRPPARKPDRPTPRPVPRQRRSAGGRSRSRAKSLSCGARGVRSHRAPPLKPELQRGRRAVRVEVHPTDQCEARSSCCRASEIWSWISPVARTTIACCCCQ